MPSSKSASPKLNTPDKIKELAYKKGVTILLDMDGSTEEAKAGCTYSYSRKSKTLTIVAASLEIEHKPLLLEIIKKVFKVEGLILKSGKEGILDSYKEYASENNNKNILEFFSGILPRDDFSALKMSFYLRHEKEKGVNVYGYKKDIMDRFGDRGANIANLCTAGYFESEFMPLYNKVSKEKFKEYYEIAVGEKARALFVHVGMNKDDIEIAFNDILQKALKYHMEDFRIHGMGKQNVNHIKSFFSTKQSTPEDNFIIQKGYDKTKPSPAIEYIIKIINA